MSSFFDKVRQTSKEEGLEIGMNEGLRIEKYETSRMMISAGRFSLEDIALSTTLPIDSIKKLAC